MEETGSREGNDPEADDEGADGEDPVAGAAIARREGCGFANAKNLPADANAHQKGAEDEGEPGHGFTFGLTFLP